MKQLLSLLCVATLIIGCKNNTNPEVQTVEVEEVTTTVGADAKLAKAEFKIEGMTCAIGCAKKIEKSLAQTEGVKSAKVDFDKKLAMVEYDEDKLNTTNLESVVTKLSDTYKVSDVKTVESFDDAKPKKTCTKKDAKSCSKDCKKACCATKSKA